MKKIIIVDIDGTIADCSHRLHYIQGAKKYFTKFYSEVINDTPIPDTLQLVEELYSLGNRIVFCTGRSEEWRIDTERWLRSYFAPRGFTLFMRKEQDYRPDYVVKLELMRNAGICPESTLLVLEDRDSVVKAWRHAGYRCHQVCNGNY